jgi:hypothetical protein
MHERLPSAVNKQRQYWEVWQLPWSSRGHIKQVACQCSDTMSYAHDRLDSRWARCDSFLWLACVAASVACAVMPCADPVAASVHQRTAAGGPRQLESHEDTFHDRLGLVSGHLTREAHQAV